VIGKTAPPSDVTGFSFTLGAAGVDLLWNPAPDIDLAAYELRIGSSWESATLVAHVPQPSREYPWGQQAAGTYAFLIKAIDTSGNYSVTAAPLSVVVAAPTPPLTFMGVISGSDLVLSWQPPASGVTVTEYEVRFGGSDWASSTFIQRIKTTSLTLPVTWVGDRTFRVAAVSPPNNVGDPATVTISVQAPGQVTQARAEVVDNNVLLFWAPPLTGSLPVDHYDVREGSTWAGGTPIGSNGNSTFAAVFEQESGTFSYWVAAIDSAGNEGDPVAIVATVNQPPDYVLRVDYNDDFTGTLSGLYLEDGAVWGPSFGETIQQHFESRGWATVDDQITAGYPLVFEPSATSGYYERVLDYGAVLPATTITVTANAITEAGAVTTDVQISYKTASGDPWTDATAGALSVLATNFRYVKVRVTFTASGGDDLVMLAALNIKLASKLKTDSGSASAVSTDSGGTVVPFNVAFVDVDSINVTPLGTAARYGIVNFVGVPNPTSFQVLLYDSSGSRVSGDFSWTARGY